MRNGLIGLVSAMVLASTMATAACSDSNSSGGTGGTAATTGGSSSSGGNAPSNGGQQSTAGGATGGSATGGAATGGSATGGSATGGSATGGSATGTGGAATGGSGATTGGSSSTGGSPPNVSPCGGDVVGTWTVTSSRLTVSGEVDMSVIGVDCTRGQITGGSLQVSGTFTANSDMSYSDNTTTTGDVEFTLEPLCLHWSGATTTCDGLARSGIPALGFDNTSSCVAASGGGCTCHGHVNQSGWMGVASLYASTSDVYAISGTVLTLSPTTVPNDPYQYCVSGNTLTLTPQTTYPTTSGTIVLQKQ